MRRTAATAYGGTVSNCAIAFAICYISNIMHDQRGVRVMGGSDCSLLPKVVMMVGKNAEIDARAQFSPKYMAPPVYICRRGSANHAKIGAT